MQYLRYFAVLFFLVIQNTAFGQVAVQAEVPARKNTLLVRHKANIQNKRLIESVHAQAKAKVIRSYKLYKELELVQLQPGTSVASALAVYNADNNVLYAEPNYIYHSTVLPDDEKFANQWNLHNTSQSGGFVDADINAPEAWEVTTGSVDVVIAVVDTGIDYNHEDLKNNVWVNPGEIAGNGIDDDENGYIDDVHGVNTITKTGDPLDDDKHGTHVSGIIGAEGNNGIGISGVMQNVKLLACKFLDDKGEGDTATAIACLEYLTLIKLRKENPVNIIASNNSWSGAGNSRSLLDAIKEMQKAEILFVAAASNNGLDNDKAGTYPANFNLPCVISVAATDFKDRISTYSNFGAYSVHVAAPGTQILSTLPDNKYGVLSGTSMAAPHVSGLAGLIKAFDPEASWIKIKNLIITGGQMTLGVKDKLLSDRRIRAIDVTGEGSLSCKEQKVRTLLSPKLLNQSMKLGESLTVSMLSLDCNSSYHDEETIDISTVDKPVTPIKLLDDGTGVDQIANDGIFTGSFVPAKKGNFALRFTRTDVVEVEVVK